VIQSEAILLKRPNSAVDISYPMGDWPKRDAPRMQGWMSQIVIGIIVTVAGTLIANALIRGNGGKHFYGGSYSGPARAGR